MNDKLRLSCNVRSMPALILKRETGVIYSHQAGGNSCKWPEIEGALLLLDADDYKHNIPAILSSHFSGPRWRKWCNKSIDLATADFIDEVMSWTDPHLNKNLIVNIMVDRDMLDNSFEAWVHVNVCIDDKKSDAVLVWENNAQVRQVF